MRLVLFSAVTLATALPALAAGGGGGHRFPPFDATTYPSQLFWLALTFGGLYLLMGKVALPRIGAVMEQRRETIDAALSAASAAQKSAEEQAQALESSLAKARASAQTIAGEARDRSTKDIEAQRLSVEKDLSARLIAAEASIGEMKAKALSNVEGIAKEAVGDIVERLGGKASAAAIDKAIASIRG